MKSTPAIGSVFVLLALGSPLAVLADETDVRHPIPSGQALSEADKLVETIYGDEIKAVESSDQRIALSKKLLTEAAKPNEPAGRYALLQAALDVAPDAPAAMPVIDEMAIHFKIDTLRKKASVVWGFSKSARGKTENLAVAEAASSLMDQAAKRDSYDSALKLGDLALAAAQKARDGQQVRSIRIKLLEVRKHQAKFEKVVKALAELKKNPTDANANAVVGTHKCFIKGAWESGLPMLALGGDGDLKELAVKELNVPTSSNEQVALADGWYSLAQKSDETIKERIKQRAGFWYQLSLKSDPALSRLVKAKVEKRLDSIQTGEDVKLRKKTLSKTAYLRKQAAPDAVKIGEHYYKVIWVKGSWDRAKAACEKAGGYLACCETTEERMQLGKLKGSKKVVWVGGYRDQAGKFRWLNGKEIPRSEFQERPNPFRYDFVAFNVGSEYNTRVRSGTIQAIVSKIQGFICEWDE